MEHLSDSPESSFSEIPKFQPGNSELASLTEEVKERSIKTKPDPTAIPQKLSTAEFNTTISHFYRGEVGRSNIWRTRLDATTNWAVITAGATLSFVFSSADNPHFAIPINSILVTIFLFMEARRYRYYEVWANRVRVLETGYFAPMLSHRTIPPDKKWAEHISDDLLEPHFTITEWEAVGRRLRSNYIWIFLLLALSWGLKVYLHPTPATSLEMFFARAQVGVVPGWMVIAVGFVFNALILGVAIGTLRMKNASSEVKPHSDEDWRPIQQVSNWAERKARRRRYVQKIRKARQKTHDVIHNTEI